MRRVFNARLCEILVTVAGIFAASYVYAVFVMLKAKLWHTVFFTVLDCEDASVCPVLFSVS